MIRIGQVHTQVEASDPAADGDGHTGAEREQPAPRDDDARLRARLDRMQRDRQRTAAWGFDD